MSEFITIQVGQCGNQIGNAFWPSVLEEYGIRNVPGRMLHLNKSSNKVNAQESLKSFFNTSVGKNSTSSSNILNFKNINYKARVILIDMEDSVVSNIMNGPLSKIFDEKCIITNYPGSGNNWAEGFCHHGSQFHGRILSAIRSSVESCDSLHGFLLLYSTSGGTGSGLGSYTLKMLEDYFPKIDRFVSCVYPTGTEDVITSSYNMALATKYLVNNATCVFPVENSALINIVNCQSNNRHSPETMEFVSRCKPFQDMNSIVSKALLHLTCGSRFSGSLNLDMNDIATNMIPFPKTQFLATSLSPLTVTTAKEPVSNSRHIQNGVFEGCCKKSNVLVNLDPLSLNSRLMATTLLGRGNFSMSDMRNYADKIEHRGNASAWSIKTVKVGLCNQPSIGHVASMLSLFNTTSMKQLFNTTSEHFEKIYKKRAYLHHYMDVQGFDLDYFDECRETLFSCINNYEFLETIEDIRLPRISIK